MKREEMVEIIFSYIINPIPEGVTIRENFRSSFYEFLSRRILSEIEKYMAPLGGKWE